MPLTPSFEWTQTIKTIEIILPLKGNNARTVDVFAAHNYLKVSFAQYLLELDLTKSINDLAVKAIATNGNLVLNLRKNKAELWPALIVKGERQILQARRFEAIETRRALEKVLHQKAKEDTVETDRAALRAQMAMEQMERQQLDNLKAEEKRQAEQDIYKTFGDMQVSTLQQVRTATGTAAQSAAAEQKALLDNAAVYLEGDQDTQENNEKGSLIEAGDSTRTDEDPPLQEEAEVIDKEEQVEDKVCYVPPPRSSQGCRKVIMKFTPRIFPTPSRESKRMEEEDWIARNRPHLFKNKALNRDTRDISESDPLWLKGKGDDFYRAGDYLAAINAFSASLEVESAQANTLSNRAACYLQLCRFEECVTDCSKALKLINRAHRALCLRVHVRRGVAFVQLGHFAEAQQDYEEAHQIAPEDADLRHDLACVQDLVECSRRKAEGDKALAARKLENAHAAYTAVLQLNPTFVAALANRAVCHLSQGRRELALQDCDAALACMEEGGSSLTQGQVPVISSVPPRGSKRRHSYVLRLLARRAVTRADLGFIKEARADYEAVVKLVGPADAELRRDLELLKDEILEKEGLAAGCEAAARDAE